MIKAGDRVWLRSSHPSFFFIFMCSAVCDLVAGFVMMLGKPEWFTSPTLIHVVTFAGRQVWGAGFAAVGIAMLIGLVRPTFNLARLALMAGACLHMLRSILIAYSLWTGDAVAAGGIPFLFLAAACHYSQTMEPPTNPATAVRR